MITDSEMLLPSGFLRLRAAKEYSLYNRTALREWCALRGRYTLVTTELVEWLRERIRGRRAIEVGSGMGDLGYHLDIPMTDSWIQAEPEMQLYYRLTTGQAAIIPPACVEKLTAEVAIARYKPQVVVASWLTQKYQLGDEGPPPVGSCVYGPDMELLADLAGEFILIGNATTHKDLRLLKRPHEEFQYPWIVSRAAVPEHGRIWVWPVRP